jgi:hypothetical protein
VTDVYIEDVWYPRVSSIWGPSRKPDALVPVSLLPEDILPWRRPTGRYPGKDGKYVRGPADDRLTFASTSRVATALSRELPTMEFGHRVYNPYHPRSGSRSQERPPAPALHQLPNSRRRTKEK